MSDGGNVDNAFLLFANRRLARKETPMTDVKKLRIEAAANLICEVLDRELAETNSAITRLQERLEALEKQAIDLEMASGELSAVNDRLEELSNEVDNVREEQRSQEHEFVSESDMESYVDNELSDLARLLTDDDSVRENFKGIITEYFRDQPMTIRPAEQ